METPKRWPIPQRQTAEPSPPPSGRRCLGTGTPSRGAAGGARLTAHTSRWGQRAGAPRHAGPGGPVGHAPSAAVGLRWSSGHEGHREGGWGQACSRSGWRWRRRGHTSWSEVMGPHTPRVPCTGGRFCLGDPAGSTSGGGGAPWQELTNCARGASTRGVCSKGRPLGPAPRSRRAAHAKVVPRAAAARNVLEEMEGFVAQEESFSDGSSVSGAWQQVPSRSQPSILRAQVTAPPLSHWPASAPRGPSPSATHSEAPEPPDPARGPEHSAVRPPWRA